MNVASKITLCAALGLIGITGCSSSAGTKADGSADAKVVDAVAIDGASADAAIADGAKKVDATSLDAKVLEDGSKADAVKKADAAPAADLAAGCPTVEPKGYCPTLIGKTCVYGARICRCQTVCSGMQPPPGKTHAWSCGPPPPTACPKSTPKNGSTCNDEGLTCNYGSCGGSIAKCTSGKWAVKFIPPPP